MLCHKKTLFLSVVLFGADAFAQSLPPANRPETAGFSSKRLETVALLMAQSPQLQLNVIWRQTRTMVYQAMTD